MKVYVDSWTGKALQYVDRILRLRFSAPPCVYSTGLRFVTTLYKIWMLDIGR